VKKRGVFAWREEDFNKLLSKTSLSQDWLGHGEYYWVIDQAEYSTDLLFTKPAALADLYPRLLEHASLKFSAPDILAFLGRRLSPL
jgi:hypothetical protein